MKTNRYGISGSTLKIIAAISMVLDHVSRIVLTNGIMTHASYSQISDEQWAILSEASDVGTVKILSQIDRGGLGPALL